jgi:AraC-like DNA-binding protein
LKHPDHACWDEIAAALAGAVLQISSTAARRSAPTRGAEAQVTSAVRYIEACPGDDLTLTNLARHAGLSPFHFLRAFQQVTGITPHQYILRTRLREAAHRLTSEAARVLDIALDCGFGDVSNFNRAFRAEFGCSPRTYRNSPD